MNHIKRLLALFIVVAVYLLTPIHAHALGSETNIPDGLLIGDDTGITVTKNGGYFFKLEGLLPGDTITRNLVIQNKKDVDYSLMMEIEAVSTEGSIDFLEDMTMKFRLGDEIIFDGNLVNDNGTTDQKKVIDFGVIKAQSTQSMNIELKVKGNIPWDKFIEGESKAVTRWTFFAQRPEEPTSNSSVPKETPKPKPVGRFPQTGDSPSSILFLVSGLMILITVVLFVVLSKKEKDETDQKS